MQVPSSDGELESMSTQVSFSCDDMLDKERLKLDMSGDDLRWDSSDGLRYQTKPFLRKLFYRLETLQRILLVAAVAAVMVIFLISFYGIIIINFMFFVTSIMSYVLSPLYRGLGNDWPQFAYSVLQVIVTCPYVQFYILFIVSSITQFADSLPSFSKILVMLWDGTLGGDPSEQRTSRYEPWKKVAINWNILKKLGWSFVALCFGVGVFAVAFLYNKTSIILGLFPYLGIVIQILGRVGPIYRYWWQFLWTGRIEASDSNNSLNKFVNDMVDMIHDMKKVKKNQATAQAQTYDSVFVGKVTEHLYMPDGSYSSSGFSSSSAEALLGNEDDDGDDEDDSESDVIIARQPDEKKQKRKEEDNAAQEQRAQQDSLNELSDFWDNVSNVFLALTYKKIYKLGVQIAEDPVNPYRNRNWLGIFTLLNIGVMAFDIYRATKVFSAYFVVSIIIRIIFLPLASYFHCLVVVFNKVKNSTLNLVMWIGFGFTVLVLIASAAGVLYSTLYIDTERIAKLDRPTGNQVEWNWTHVDLSAPVCAKTFSGFTVAEAIGFALGPYDVDRDQTVFNNQMSHLFGNDWAKNIEYEVKWINEQVPIVIYDVKDRNMTVFGFRGFASGSELAFQIELFAIHYVLPFFQDMIPFVDYMIDWFIGFYTVHAHNFGFHFFDPTAMINDFMDPILTWAKQARVSEIENVLFSGVNVGGVFAKLAGMITHRPAVGFITLPAYNDFFTMTFDLEDEAMTFVTNVYNYGGLFCAPEPNVANNIGLPSVPFSTLKKDQIYQSFCTIVEACRLNSRYDEYCRSIIGDDVDAIHDFFNQETFDVKYDAY